MSEELIQYGDAVNGLKKAESFQNLLNKSPEKNHVRTNKFAQGALYLPIGYIENLLDEMYAGLWKTTGRTEIHGNSIVAHVHLSVFHPVFKTWLKRYGVGAIAIQLDKGEKDMNFSNLKSDAFKKGEPAAKAQALRNAAQSLGVIFGRNLNREDVPDYEPLTDQVAAYQSDIEELMVLIENSGYSDDKKQTLKQRAMRSNIKGIAELISKLKNENQ